MPHVIERLSSGVEGQEIVHVERPVAWDDADRIAGRRLDRRKNYAVIDGQVCSAISWTGKCSGCSNFAGDERGFGCEECGYTGKVRQSYWMPDDGSEPL